MRVLGVLLLLVAVASAQEKEAADQVLAAWQAKDAKALAALAAKDKPDPWIVADELCFRGEHDAAEAFAKAAPRKATEKLPAYVASRRGKTPNAKAREALATANKALLARDPKAALAATEAVDPKAVDVVSVRLLFGRGFALAQLGRFEEAEKVFLAAADAAEHFAWLRRAASGLRYAGYAEFFRSRWSRALAPWQRSLKLKEELGDRAGVAELRGSIGLVHEKLGSYAKALDDQERSRELYEELGDRAGLARAFRGIGNVHLRLGSYAKALDCQERSRELEEELGNRAGIAASLTNIGLIHRSLGSFAKALDYHERSLKLQEELGNRAGVAKSLGNIGTIQARVGSYAKALDYQERSLKLEEELGDREGIAASLNNIGLTHEKLGSYAKALAYLERSLKLREELGDRAGVAASFVNIGNIHQSLGDNAKALEFYEKGLNEAEAIGHRRWAVQALGNIGSIHAKLGAYEKALAYHERTMALQGELGNRSGVAEVLGNIGAAHGRLGSLSKALAYHERALKLNEELGSRAGAINNLIAISTVHQARGDLTEARRFLERSVRAARRLRATPKLVVSLRALARLHLVAGEPSRALGRAREALREIEGLLGGLGEEQGAQAREQYAGLFAIGALAAVWEEDAAEALTFLESGRAGALLDALGKREALRWKVESLPPELQRLDREAQTKERAARRAYDAAVVGRKRKEIRAAAQALDEATEAVRAVAGRIQRALKQQARLFYPRAETIDSIQAALEEDQALVLYGLCLNGALALVLRHDGERIVLLGKVAEITAACAAFDATDPEVDPTVALNALRKLLVDPLKLGDDVKQVLVSPEGPLCYVPFGALFAQPMAMTPSGTTHVLLLGEQRAKGEGILALGDPDYKGASKGAQAIYYRGRTLSPLPATREEAEAIGTKTLLGADATEAGLKVALPTSKRWRAVHFACHGLVNVDRPMLSSLALAREGEDDGFLTALEVLRTKIPADLAVLSACETARGKIVKGEGIVGLTRAFMFAGTPRVICSLWKVDDEATQALMVKFYENWKTQPTATALRNAQAFVRGHEKWKHPYYWAAWQLWGLPN